MLDAVFDLRLTSMPFPDVDPHGKTLPVIPSRTYSLSDSSMIDGEMEWNDIRLTGRWSVSFISRDESGGFLTSSRIVPGNIDNFWPIEYMFHESSMNSDWLFTGTRNVPEAGATSRDKVYGQRPAARCIEKT